MGSKPIEGVRNAMARLKGHDHATYDMNLVPTLNDVRLIEIHDVMESGHKLKDLQSPKNQSVSEIEQQAFVDQKIGEMVGENAEIFLMPLKDLTLKQQFSENSALCRAQSKFDIVAEIALSSGEELIAQGVNPSDIAPLNSDLQRIGFRLGMREEAQKMLESDPDDLRIRQKQQALKSKFGL